MAKVDDKDLLPGKVDDADLAPEGEAGVPGPNPYAGGPNAHQQSAGERTLPLGGAMDAAVSWANKAALGGGAQIAGLIGGYAQDAKNLLAGEPLHPQTAPSEAYKFVRDEAAQRIKDADETKLGSIAGPIGVLSTPGLPKPTAGASIPARGLQAAKTGGTIGGLNAAFSSKADLTSGDIEDLKQFLKDTGGGVAGGAVTSGALGAGLAATEKPLRAAAEEQALRAAGLRAGIKNAVQKDLGVPNMEEARKVGRGFLDEKLIPPIGSSEAVANRAEALRGRAGTSIGRTLGNAERAGTFDSSENAQSVRDMLAKESAPADEMSGAKARALASSLESQGQRTPGSFIGQNKAKSDAWKSANFDSEAPMAAQLYRKAVGAATGNIEDQVSRTLGPRAGAELAAGNRKYGTAMDALGLARNESTREAAKSGIGPMKEALALLSGSVAGGAAGHPVAGAGLGLAGTLGLKAADKYGHSTAARFADYLAKPSSRTSGAIGGHMGAEAWARFLGKPDDEETP